MYFFYSWINNLNLSKVHECVISIALNMWQNFQLPSSTSFFFNVYLNIVWFTIRKTMEGKRSRLPLTGSFYEQSLLV